MISTIKNFNFVTPFRSQHLKHQDTSCLLCCDGSCSPLYLHDWVLSVGHMVGNTWANHTKHVIKVDSWSNHWINNILIVFIKQNKKKHMKFSQSCGNSVTLFVLLVVKARRQPRCCAIFFSEGVVSSTCCAYRKWLEATLGLIQKIPYARIYDRISPSFFCEYIDMKRILWWKCWHISIMCTFICILTMIISCPRVTAHSLYLGWFDWSAFQGSGYLNLICSLEGSISLSSILPQWPWWNISIWYQHVWRNVMEASNKLLNLIQLEDYLIGILIFDRDPYNGLL